jgi:uncharacterized protein
MLLDLSQFRESRAHLDRTYPPGPDGLVPGLTPEGEQGELRVLEPVRLSVDVFKDGTQYHLVGRVTTRLALECSRCVEDYPFDVDIPFDLLYVPHTENVGDGESEIEEDDMSTAYYSDERIDLGHLIREQLYLAIPMKPLCRESCRGLCPECGTNLNTSTCTCAVTWVDPRLDALRSLADRRDPKA